MLRAMRGAAETWVLKLLMVVLVVSFCLWGVGDIFRGNPQQRTVACIGGFFMPFDFLLGSSASICTGERITVQALNRDFRRSFDALRQQRGPDFTVAAAKRAGMLDRVLRESVARKLFDHTAQDFGLRYDTRSVLQQLANTPELQTKDGRFDEDKFRKVIGGLHMTEAEFVAYMRESFAREQSIGIFSALATLPQSLVDQVLQAQGQERLTQIVRLPHDKLPLPADPDAAALAKFHETHPALFTAPEYRSVALLKIMLEDVAKHITVTDEEIAAAFEKHKDELAQGERRDVLQVVLADEAAARKLAATAQAQKDLRKAALAAGQDPVMLESQTEESIPPALYATVFSAEPGAIGEPVKSDFGWHVTQVVKIKPAVKPTFQDSKETLRARLQRERAGEDIQDQVNRIDDALAGGQPLDEIAPLYQFKLDKFPMVDAEGRDATGKKLDIYKSEMVLKNAFELGEGDVSAILSDQRGNYLVIRVEKIMPSRLRALEESKDKVLAAWRADQKRQAASDAAAKIMAEWQAEPNLFAALGKRPGLTVSEGPPISILGGSVPGLPQNLQSRIFDLKPGVITIGADNAAHYIVRLTGLRAFDQSKHSEAQSGLKLQLERGWRGDVLDSFESALRQRYKVRINQGILQEMRSSDTAQDDQ